jgi:NADPH:quinone reductase-like Zn-dependent oxidoreductase
MAPSTTKAIVIKGKAQAAIEEVPVPQLRDDYILVKTTAVALNPTDWKHIEGYGGNVDGCRSGCDYAGIVEEVGSKVTKDFKKGDRVCGVVHGA